MQLALYVVSVKLSVDTICTCVFKSFFTHISVKAVIISNMKDLKSVNRKTGFICAAENYSLFITGWRQRKC